MPRHVPRAVVDDADPLQQYRLGVIVPEVYGDDVPVWAAASRGSSGAMPVVGDLVWISLEHGDTDYPIWQLNAGTEGIDEASGEYVGKYHGLVVDNDDPLQLRRLEVSVPEVTTTAVWATASIDVENMETPAIGAGVWIQYEHAVLSAMGRSRLIPTPAPVGSE
ncbi:MAG: phage baseplate assembly protein V [Ilumatobacteraceae bacterium]